MAIALGALFALALYPVWSLEGRWFVVTVLGVFLVASAMIVAGYFSQLGFFALLFSVPVAGFAKWTFLDEDAFSQDVRDAALYSGTLGLGAVDFLLAGLYLAWVFRVLVLRERFKLRWDPLDSWVLLFLVANVLSQWGAEQPLAAFALQHQIKYSLLYFYVSRHFRPEHLPWFLASIAFAVLLESAIGVLQAAHVLPPGLILDKGGGSELLEQQYKVPGIEHIRRSTGTLYDSHALGTYIAMLVPFLLMFLYRREQPWSMRLVFVALVGLAFAALATTYSRSAWLGTVLSSGVCFLVLLLWRERFVFWSLFLVGIAAMLSGPWLLSKLFARLFNAPIELLLVRFEQFPIAWDIWREDFFFGAGAGNYMVRMFEANTDWSLQEPVHNVFLFIGAEMGLLGVVAYYGLALATLWRLWRIGSGGFDAWSRIAFAAMAGLLAYFFDGMSNPIFREPTIYSCFWVSVAITVAMSRFTVNAVRDKPGVGRITIRE